MKLWGGRFTKSTDAATDHFHSSISFDRRLYRQDIAGSIAHANMLGKQGIISPDEAETLRAALLQLLEDIDAGTVEFDETAEDIHMNIETILISRIGNIGKKLHTGRSRNDQVALDMRMYVKNEISEIVTMLVSLQKIILDIAEANLASYMPGYTHLQKAQPVTLAHHIMSYYEMLKRDISRLTDCNARVDVMPLGSGALASTIYPLDRDAVANELGFSQITDNSMDGVSDRDFCIEFCGCLSIIMMHLSRFSEEIILWSSNEYQFIELDDGYSTGSSIMPQKKNPDMAELIRGKTGRVYGSLMTLLTVMKGLPLAYNKDMQEDKEAMFDAIDTVKMCLPVFSGMLATARFNIGIMHQSAKTGLMNATDAADWLVGHGVAFRDAHEIIGRLVLYCVQNKKGLEELRLDEFQSISPVFDDSIYEAIALTATVERRNVHGGPSPQYMRDYVKRCREVTK